jgi:hypothetical protein
MPWYPVAAETALASNTTKLQGGDSLLAPPSQPAEKIPAPADLAEWQWEQYQLEADVAGKLGLAVVSAHADVKSRVIVAEFSRSTTVVAEDSQCRYGVVARLVVKVRNLESGANLTLPFVAAEAQFNRLEASASLRVEGYVGKDAGKSFPNFGAFDVESYVKLMDALTSLKNTISEDEANIRPQRLWVWGEPAASSIDDQLTTAVGTVWALASIEQGKPQAQAVGEYRDSDDETARAAIAAVYSVLAVESDRPSEVVRAHARELLDGYKMRSPLFG